MSGDSAPDAMPDSQNAASNGPDKDGFGHVIVERSGGIGGFLMVWDVDIDASTEREVIGPQVAALPWSETSAAETNGADRFVYEIESRFGQVRLGETQLDESWRRLIDTVATIAQPYRRPPG